jgi:hypothetical protein
MADCTEEELKPRSRKPPKEFIQLHSKRKKPSEPLPPKIKAPATRGERGGVRGFKKTKVDVPLEPIILDEVDGDGDKEAYPNPQAIVSPTPYHVVDDTRQQSVIRTSIERPSPRPPNIARSSPSTFNIPTRDLQTPQLETDIESQTHQTESSRESESQTTGPNGRTKLKRLNYQWDYTTEHAMLQSLSKAKNSGLQTHTTFKDKAWLDCQVAVDAAQTDPRAPPIDMTRLSSKWQTFKNWWSDYCRHYGVGGIEKFHCSGWQPNGTTANGLTRSYTNIEPGVLVSSEEVMAEHYYKYPACRKFKTAYPKHTELLEALLLGRQADGRDAGGIDDLVEHEARISTSPSPRASTSSAPVSRRKRARKDLRKKVLTKSTSKATEDAGFAQLALALRQPRQAPESVMARAIKKADQLEIFKGNTDVLVALFELFYAEDRKADFFLHLPEHMMEWWVEKEFGDTIMLDLAWKDRQLLHKQSNRNSTGVVRARKGLVGDEEDEEYDYTDAEDDDIVDNDDETSSEE